MTDEEIYKVITIDKDRKTKITIQLRDKSGDEISLQDAVQKLTDHVHAQLNTEDSSENPIRLQIFPLMSQACVIALKRLIGLPSTAVLMAHDKFKFAIIESLIVSFLLHRWMSPENKDKAITINTTEEPMTDDEMESLEKVSRITNAATLATAFGYSGTELIKELIRTGEVTEEDLKKMDINIDSLIDEKDKKEEN